MSKVSKNFDAGQSAVARIKRRDALKRQRIAIVSVAIVIALLQNMIGNQIRGKCA